MSEPTSASEKQFNTQVANSPIVKEILEDLSGLKQGQLKLGEDMKALEKKVDNGFEILGAKIDQLAEVVTENKFGVLEKKLEDTEKALDRKKDNGDKIKNYSITTLLGTIAMFVLENIGVTDFIK